MSDCSNICTAQNFTYTLLRDDLRHAVAPSCCRQMAGIPVEQLSCGRHKLYSVRMTL